MLEEIRKGYIGHPAQLCTVRRVTLEEGKARGSEIIEVKTAGGLELDLLPGNGLDIGQARYLGQNMTFLCKNGYDSPAVDHPFELEFLHTFPGGLLYSCGLRNAGPAGRDGSEWQPIHGRLHTLPAELVSAEVSDDTITVSGTVRETALFGSALVLKRVIRIPVYGSSVEITDTLTNETPRDEQILQLYHCNFGYPLLSEEARLILPENRTTEGKSPYAQEALDRQLFFEAPGAEEKERVYLQDMQEEFWARLENPALKIAMTLSWSGDTLPTLSEWRTMAFGDYALGLEPTNCRLRGRVGEREADNALILKAFESRTNRIEIRFSAL